MVLGQAWAQVPGQVWAQVLEPESVLEQVSEPGQAWAPELVPAAASDLVLGAAGRALKKPPPKRVPPRRGI